MPAHTQKQLLRAILILIALTVFAVGTLLVADTHNAAPEETDTTVATREVQPPGSSLDGINEPLSAVILWQRTVHDNEVAAAEQARQQAAAAAAARPRTVTASAPPVRSAPTTQCPADVVALIHKYWDRFGVDVANWAVGIAWRESNCRPDVTSPTNCAGTFQLAVPLHADLFTALGYDWRTAAWQSEPNIAAAALLYSSSGPGPWRL